MLLLHPSYKGDGRVREKLHSIVADIRPTDHAKALDKLEVAMIGDAQKVPVVAIDGGSSMLWSNGIRSIGVIRVGFIAYDPSYRIIKTHVKSEFFSIESEGSLLDLERHKQEVNLIKEASLHAQLILFDGALSNIPDKGMEKALEKTTSCATVVGVSKKSSMSFIAAPYPDTWLPFRPNTYYEIPGAERKRMIDSKSLVKSARVFLAKLHGNGPTLRIDISGKSKEVFEVLRHYSSYRLCPGYPFPLEEIHRIVCLDDKREIYEHKLRKEMEHQGLLKEYFKGKIVKGMESNGFHSVLDDLV